MIGNENPPNRQLPEPRSTLQVSAGDMQARSLAVDATPSHHLVPRMDQRACDPAHQRGAMAAVARCKSGCAGLLAEIMTILEGTACKTCAGPVEDDEIALSFGVCLGCERRRRAELLLARQGSLLSLPDDCLLHVLVLAASGRAGHRTACTIARVCRALHRSVSGQLWQLLCELEAPALARRLLGAGSGATASDGAVQAGRTLHRALSVPIKFRTRSFKSWRLDRALRRLRLESPPVLHLDPNAPPLSRKQARGQEVWAPSDQLLSWRGRHALLGAAGGEEMEKEARGEGGGDVGGGEGGGALPAHSLPAESCGLFAVVREASPTHMLVVAMIPQIGRRARRLLSAMPAGYSPSDRQDEVWRRPPRRALQRCLACASRLRHSARDSGAVVAPGASRLMRDARSWFRREVSAPWGGSRPSAGGADGASAALFLEQALVCSHGHAVLCYEAFEGLARRASGEAGAQGGGEAGEWVSDEEDSDDVVEDEEYFDYESESHSAYNSQDTEGGSVVSDDSHEWSGPDEMSWPDSDSASIDAPWEVDFGPYDGYTDDDGGDDDDDEGAAWGGARSGGKRMKLRCGGNAARWRQVHKATTATPADRAAVGSANFAY